MCSQSPVCKLHGMINHFDHANVFCPHDCTPTDCTHYTCCVCTHVISSTPNNIHRRRDHDESGGFNSEQMSLSSSHKLMRQINPPLKIYTWVHTTLIFVPAELKTLHLMIWIDMSYCRIQVVPSLIPRPCPPAEGRSGNLSPNSWRSDVDSQDFCVLHILT